MTQAVTPIERLTPDGLVVHFSRSPLMMGILLSIVLHAVVIGGLSYDYIYYDWINPAAGQARQAEQEKLRAQAAQLKAEQDEAALAASKPPVAPATTQPTGKNPLVPESQPGQSPVEQRVNEMPKEGEIPPNPFNDLGISIDQTNTPKP